MFVGTSAAGLLDIRATPLGQNVPGVSLHAQALEQILTGSFLARPDWADGLEITVVAAAGLLVAAMMATFLTMDRNIGWHGGVGGISRLLVVCVPFVGISD